MATSLATSSVPSNPPVDPRKSSLLEQNRLTVEQLPPNCNLAACLGLPGVVNCVISAITAGDSSALQRCITNGLTQVAFLMSLGICVTTPGNDTVVREALLSTMMSFQTRTSAGVDSVASSVMTSMASATMEPRL
ncbi:hypothetical protein N7512_001670 [Penicillium capsulatum]|nr:hypothetical protein N7512_001670 [Penicillium capsulatum]